MNNILELILIMAIAVAGFTIIYRIMPFKKHGATRPKFTLFPKYVAPLQAPVADIERSLDSLEFTRTKNGSFARGKVYGDFSARAIKLSVEIDENNNQIKVFASFFGILFDTGDIWQVTADILQGAGTGRKEDS